MTTEPRTAAVWGFESYDIGLEILRGMVLDERVAWDPALVTETTDPDRGRMLVYRL